MEFEKFVERPCNCKTRIKVFTAAEAKDGRGQAYIGSIVKCDCGRRWQLHDHQFDGEYWRELTEDEEGRRGGVVSWRR